jgi:hypothetical protein
MPYDAIVKNGLWFDGTGAPGLQRNLGVENGRVVIASESPLDERGCGSVIDARGNWVMPGFVDLHTHYDAEVIAAPSLSESVRHGVTSVALSIQFDGSAAPSFQTLAVRLVVPTPLTWSLMRSTSFGAYVPGTFTDWMTVVVPPTVRASCAVRTPLVPCRIWSP